jgi:hypothetical protein
MTLARVERRDVRRARAREDGARFIMHHCVTMRH